MPKPSPTPAAPTQAQAIEALRAGGVVLAPCESGYLVVSNNPIPDSARLLPDSGGFEPQLRPAHQRLVRRLCPGPVVFHVENESFRVPAPSPAAALAGQLAPLWCLEVTDAQGRALSDLGDVRVRLEELNLRPVHTIESPVPSVRAGATHIALARDGGVRVLRTGAYEERYVRKLLRTSVLFVCTGNTCRSPMAEAIARGLLHRAGASDEVVRVSSAGVGASPGAPATPEAVQAVRALGFELAGHSSRPLTKALIDEADEIYAMTRSHLAALLSVDPTAGSKARLLDPDGADVPDPIGHGASTYHSTARRIVDMIARRLQEFAP